MRFLFFIFTFLSFFASLHSQVDVGTGGKNNGPLIGVNKQPVKEVIKPISLDFENDNGFKNAKKELDKKRAKEKQEQEQNNKGIVTSEIMAQRNYKKNIEGNFNNFPMIDMDLGSFHTTSEFIYISSYDFGRFDGDKVAYIINGKIYRTNFLLTPEVKTIKIPLEIGINKIEVKALNEGELSPNTAYFAFFDDKKNVIKENQWTLATGAKVIAVIVRDEK